jgi:predicted PurR-regulated permease PerM
MNRVTQLPSRNQAPPSRADSAAITTSGLLTFLVIVVVVAGLYFGRTVFIPLALAMLLSFALAPPVRWLRHLRFPRLPAVLTVVTLAFVVILAFGWIVSWQIADLAGRLPAYQRNIETKIEALRESPPGGRLFQRAADMLRDLGRKIESEDPLAADNTVTGPADQPSEEPKPLPVEIHEPPLTPMQLVRSLIGPLLGPLATAGIVIVFVIFMLLKREDLRDRVIRLLGARDFPRTTQALDDAGHRVGQYLLMQLVVNVTYGFPIGLGLWLIGLPNPILWGLLATVLRFVPYIGPIIAAFFPLALAIAVDPGWTTLLWAAALFIVVELISNNAIEPWLYGSSTGLSPIAIIAAAIFWTWLWGPLGLLLSTPLTVCLVVLGQHVPQLSFLDIILGDAPVLTPAESLYQRLLVGDPNEATERAEEFLRERPLEDFYEEVGVAALGMAEHDRERSALSEDQLLKVAESAMLLVDNLAEYEDLTPPDEEQVETEAAPPERQSTTVAPVNAGLVLCAGARGSLDEASAAMLAQLLERRGLNVRLLPYRSLQSARLKELDLAGVSAVVLCYMNSDSLAHARFLVRRLRRYVPNAAIIVGLWTFRPEDMATRDPLTATRADRIATSLTGGVAEVLDVLAPKSTEARAAARPTLAAVADG